MSLGLAIVAWLGLGVLVSFGIYALMGVVHKTETDPLILDLAVCVMTSVVVGEFCWFAGIPFETAMIIEVIGAILVLAGYSRFIGKRLKS